MKRDQTGKGEKEGSNTIYKCVDPVRVPRDLHARTHCVSLWGWTNLNRYIKKDTVIAKARYYNVLFNQRKLLNMNDEIKTIKSTYKIKIENQENLKIVSKR